MEDTSQPAIASSGHAPRVEYLIPVISIIVLVLILAAGAAYLFMPSVRTSVAEATALMRLPSDLRGALYQVGEGNQYHFVRVQGIMLTPASDASGIGTAQVAPRGDAYVYTAVVSGGKQISKIPFATILPSGTSTIFFQTKGSEPTVIARGYAPAFLDDTHVVYVAAGGIAVWDTVASQSTLIERAQTKAIRSDVVYSPDRKLMLWTDAHSGQSILARVTPTTYEIVHVFTELERPVLTPNALYDVRVRAQGTEVWRYTLDGSSLTRIAELPASLKILGIFN